MSGHFALLVQPDQEIRAQLSQALSGAGFKVMGVTSEQEAAGEIEKLRFSPPDVVLTPLNGSETDVDGVLGWLRSDPSTENVPVVVLARREDGDERRRALRLGLTHLVPPPYEEEELVLTTRLAIDSQRGKNLLSGTLDQLSMPDLLQTLESTRRSGTVTVKSRDRQATLWLRDGRVIDAEADGGLRGQEAVFTVSLWQKGSFEADFRPVSVPERITVSTSFLLLEAMRRRDEAHRREETPPYAAMPDLPPRPPRMVLAMHRALTLLTVATSYASEHLTRPLLAQRFEGRRRDLAGQHPELDLFTVDSEGCPALAEGVGNLDDPEVEATVEVTVEVTVEGIVEGVTAWLRTLFDDLEAALPGRFSLSRLKALTEAVQDDLENLGFYRALGLGDEKEGGAP